MSVYESIMQGLNEAVEYEKGTGKARCEKCTVMPVPEFSPDEIKEVRASLRMTQGTFAALMGVSAKTVEAWEKGTNVPLGTARRMLALLQADSTLPVKYDIIVSA